MTSGKERIINSTVLHLRAIEFVTNRIVIGRGLEALFRVLKRKICGHAGQRSWFTVPLRQLVGGAKIILAGLVFRNTEPGIAKPVGMLFNGSPKSPPGSALWPKTGRRGSFLFSQP